MSAPPQHTTPPTPRRAPPGPQSASGWRATVALMVGVIAAFANIYTTQPILPVIGRIFAVSPARSGLTLSAVVLCVGLAATLYGPLSDRIGRKPVMVWTCALLTLPTLGAALAPNFGILLLCRLLQGLLIPGTTAVAVAMVQDEFPPERRGAATGAWVSATTVGGLAGRLIAGLAADLGGWQWAFVVTACTTALGAILMARWLPGSTRYEVRSTKGRGNTLVRWRVNVITSYFVLRTSYLALFRYFRQRRIVGAALIGFSLFFAFIAIFTYLPYRVAAPPFSLGPGATGSLFLTYIVGTVITPWTGRLSDALGRRATLGGAIVVIAVGLALTAPPSLPAILLGLVFLSCGLFAAQATVTAFVGENAPGAKGSATAFYLLFYYLGATCSPPLAGFVWQNYGWSALLTLCVAMLLGGLTALLTLCH